MSSLLTKVVTPCILVIAASVIFTGPVASQDSLSDDLKLLTDLMARPLAARALQWECTPSVRYVCTPEGCEQNPYLVSVRLDLAEKTYARCDPPKFNACETYPMIFSADGIFTTFNQPSSGSTFLKVLNDGSQYLEVVSLLISVHQNFGACRSSR